MKNKGLEARNALLTKMFEYEHERAEEWREVAERNAQAVKELQAELSYYIKVNPNLRKKYRNTIINRTLYNWFLEHLKDNGKEVSYKLVYDRAVSKNFLKKIKNSAYIYGVDQKKAIEDKIRKRLKAHCRLNNLKLPE